MVAALMKTAPNNDLMYLVPPFTRNALLHAAKLPAEHPSVEAARYDACCEITESGFLVREKSIVYDDDNDYY